MRHIDALVAELRENIGTGGVVSNAGDEGCISAKPGDGDHGRRDHATSLLRATLDRCPSLGRRDLGKQEEIVDAREAKSEDAGTAQGLGRIRGSRLRGHNSTS